jgi:N-acetylglucosaminyl-diphospho-decaprenol L-rhamnosyltransferase
MAAMAPAPQLTVQVVSYRTRAYLERCLASVAADLREGPSHEIRLLENASGEDLEPLAARYRRCTLRVAERNLGFGAGHNLLAAGARAPYLLILNPDTEIVEPGTIRRLLAALASGPQIAVAGPRLLDASGATQRWDHGRLHGLRAQISYRGGYSYWREAERPLEVAWVSGAAMLVARASFEAVGGFDESFFLYKEDEDLCLRIRRRGGAVLYDPRVAVLHHGSVVAPRARELAGAERRFIAKHFARARGRRAFAAVHRLLPRLRL